MMAHRSRLCHIVIDCDDLDRAVEFWSAALDATEEPISEPSRSVYRRLRLPDSGLSLKGCKSEIKDKERHLHDDDGRSGADRFGDGSGGW